MEDNKMLKELNACMTQCNVCYNACLHEKDVAMLIRCIELDRECAEICQLTASLFARGSVNIDKFLKLCAEICRLCAEECEKHMHDHCQKCAHICRSCSEMCLLEGLAA